MTIEDYVESALELLAGLGPLLMILSALGLADKIISFLFYLFRQMRGVFR